MRRTHTLVIGGGQAGLAMSRCLTASGLDHVVLERGRVGERWRSERWSSLRLLTPNWQSRLPGFAYDGRDPDGFMTASEVSGYLSRYAASFAAPVEDATSVWRVDRADTGFRVRTSRGDWHARNVVIATGHCDLPYVPAIRHGLPPGIVQVVPSRYRSPDGLPPGAVLIVGASATGVQLADELRAAGRDVILSASRHTRLPRRYRGRDILWWLEAMGVLGARVGDLADLDASREQPSLQLTGRPDHATLDLAVLQEKGVRIAGRLLAIDGARLRLAENLVATTAAADTKLAALLARVNCYIAQSGLSGRVPEAPPFEPTWPRFLDAPDTIDLHAARIGSVIWATGFRRAYPWLRLPVLDGSGEIRHQGGVTPEPGLYVLGLNLLRRRNSSFIDGVGLDARELSDHIAASDAMHAPATRRWGRSALAIASWPAAPTRLPDADQSVSALTNARRAPGRNSGALRYDVAIVGARCAGAALAMLLARQGLRVLAIDRGQYGSDTLSTHALMRGGVLQLRRWGLLPAIAALTPPIRTTTFHYRDETVTVPIKSRLGVDALYAPRRTVLDPLLVDAAEEAGADVRHRVALEDLVRDGTGRVRGLVARDGNGGALRVDAELVVGADGVRSTVAKLTGAATYRTAAHATGTIYAWWQGLDVQGYHWHYERGLSVGAIPTNDGLTCVFASVPGGQLRAALQPDVEQGYHRLLADGAPALAAQVRRARRAGGFHGFPGQAGFFRVSHGPGWALVGDAGYFKDPFTAHGITDALRDAELLARGVLQGTDAALADYQARRDAIAGGLFEATDRIASFEWDLEQVKVLHGRLSEEMARENEVIAGFDLMTPPLASRTPRNTAARECEEATA